MSLLERSWVGRSVPVPVVPINFLSVPFHLLVYITIYILSSYRVSIKGYCPMKIYLEQLEQLEQLERLPENHFCFDPVTGTPEVPISSRKPRLRFISFHPRNHQRNEEGVEVHSKIELQPLNKDGFLTIEIPEDNEAKIATIGVLKYIIR